MENRSLKTEGVGELVARVVVVEEEGVRGKRLSIIKNKHRSVFLGRLNNKLSRKRCVTLFSRVNTKGFIDLYKQRQCHNLT